MFFCLFVLFVSTARVAATTDVDAAAVAASTDDKKSHLQSSIDLHTVDSCLDADRSKVVFPQSALTIFGIASLGLPSKAAPSDRSVHDNHCVYVLRAPDENAKLKSVINIKNVGQTRFLRMKAFGLAEAGQNKQTRRGYGGRGRAGRFAQAKARDSTSNQEFSVGSGSIIAFQNAQKTSNGRKRRNAGDADPRNSLGGVGGVDDLAVWDEVEVESKEEEREIVGARTRRAIPYQPGKDLEYEGSMEKADEKDCYHCNGRCLDEELVKCNFVDDCGMTDETACPNPKGLIVINPIGKVVVTDPPKPSTRPASTGGGGGVTGLPGGTLDPETIDVSKFQEYLKKCDPTVYQSCLELHACMRNAQCRPNDPNEAERAQIKINLWEDRFPCGATPCREDQGDKGAGAAGTSDDGFAWWIPLVIVIVLIVLIVAIVLAVVLGRRRKRRKTADGAEVEITDGTKPTTVQVSATVEDMEVNLNQSVAMITRHPTETFESTYHESSNQSQETLNNKLQTEFEKMDKDKRGVLDAGTAKNVVGSAIGSPVPRSLWQEMTDSNLVNPGALTLLDLSLFVMEYHENGISPEKVAELFARDYPPGLETSEVARIMNRFCREGNICRMDELEDVFKELQKKQLPLIPSVAIATPTNLEPARASVTGARGSLKSSPTNVDSARSSLITPSPSVTASVDGSVKRSVAEQNLEAALKRAKYSDGHSREKLEAALAAYNAVQSKKKRGSTDTLAAPLVLGATELLRNFKEVDGRIGEEEARIEDALETEDKKKLAGLLQPGALPAMQTYKPKQLEEKLEEVRITHTVVQAKEAVNNIKPGDLAEIKSYKVPDPMILHVIQGVMIMTGYTNAQTKDWASIQKELADTSPNKLINRIIRHSMRSLDSNKVDQAAKLIKGYKIEEVKRKSRTATIFFSWMSSVIVRFQFKLASMKRPP